MPAAPAVSVLMPVHNGRKFLAETIPSVLRQTFTDFELLVGDDESTDDSLAYVRSFSDPRIRVLSGKLRLGLFGNLNRLASASRAPLLQIFCQDDVMEPEYLAEVVAFLAKHPAVGMTFAKHCTIDGGGHIVERGAFGDLPELMAPELSLQHFFYNGCFMSNLSTVAVRKRCLDELGPFDESYGVSADYEMWARVCRRWDLGVIHRHLLRVRLHREQLSAQASSGIPFIRQNRRIRQALVPLLPSSIREAALRFERNRFDVLDVHYGWRALLAGRAGDFVEVGRILGWLRFARALVGWLATLNNRLARPRPKFVLPATGKRQAS